MFNDYCIALVHRLFHLWHLFRRKTIAFMRRKNESFGITMKKSNLYEFSDVTFKFFYCCNKSIHFKTNCCLFAKILRCVLDILYHWKSVETMRVVISIVLFHTFCYNVEISLHNFYSIQGHVIFYCETRL